MIPAPVIIAVDGRSGAGKTTLAVELAARLRAHRKVSLFHLEDIYPGWDGLQDGISRYVATVLEPLRRGKRATWTSWNWETNHDGAAQVTEPAEIVLIEGVGAAAEAARPLLDAVVWAEAPAADRRRRALARDSGSYDPFWDRWAAQEEAWLAEDNVPGHADIVVRNLVDGTGPNDVLAGLCHLPALATALQPELAARRGGLKLITRKIEALPPAGSLFNRLYGGSANAVWLDSSNADQPAADKLQPRNRFSIMADGGGVYGQTVIHRSGTTTVTTGSATVRISGPFFRWLDGTWGRKAVRTPHDYPGDFTLGWLGCLGYELKRETGGTDCASQLPDASLLFAGRAVVLDHVAETVWLLALDAPDAGAWLSDAAEAVAAVGSSPAAATETPARPAPVFTARDGEQEYKAKIAEAQRQIAEGNTYEVCLTTALTAHVPAHGIDTWQAYLDLRRRNPAPFAAYLQFGNLTVASTSPERFLKISSDGGMRAEPIKGTRRRGVDAGDDQALRRDLEESPKDRAENIMIVDLLRNDLSHFAVPGTVQVSRLCAIESYATVHQMVSTIDARLLPGASRAEAVAACFPAGSMTGAPKISTMAILDRLENAPRGLYSGAIGYFSLNGATDLSVAIRTLVATADGAGGTDLSLGVGGAITADSDADAEYQEIRDKAFGVLSALNAVYPARQLSA